MTPNQSLVRTRKISKGDKYFPALTVQRLYETIDNPRDLAYVMYHIETGIRVSDVINSEWVHVDWQNMRTYTYDEKKDEWRYVYWPEKIKAKLKLWMKQMQAQGIKSRYVFPFSAKTANRIIKRWAKEIEFAHADLVGSHWCRHTFIRLSRKVGRDIKAVQQNTGDTIRTLLEWYAELGQEEMQHEISKSIID